ncbi:MAG: hypothetical protein LBS59_01610 [Puniceicoccales bacterium]|jgi:hypothetical protein|nr:hypothetical protein [Puniceicoccales bacterium]
MNNTNTDDTTPFTTDDPRLTGLALGEITDPQQEDALRAALANDPALNHEFEAIQAQGDSLRQFFRAELADSAPATRTTTAVPAHRRRHSAVSFAPARPRPPLQTREKILRFIFAGTALGTAATLLFFLSPSLPPRPIRTATHAPDAIAANETTIRLPLAPKNGYSPFSATHRPAPPRPDMTATPTSETDLASIVRRLPVLAPGKGENTFVSSKHSRTTALNLSNASQDYARRLSNNLAKGRIPERNLLRIDGLINSFPTVNPLAFAAPPIVLVAEAIPAPWAKERWFLRATVNVNGHDGSIAATDARASLTFSPTQVAAWKMLGAEDGDPAAPSLDLPVIMRTGTSLNTLFEIIPAPDAKAGTPLGEMQISFRDKNGNPATLKVLVQHPAPNAIETASEDTRFAAAAATLGLAMRQSPHRGHATLDMASQLVTPLNHPYKTHFLNLTRAVQSLTLPALPTSTGISL